MCVAKASSWTNFMTLLEAYIGLLWENMQVNFVYIYYRVRKRVVDSQFLLDSINIGAIVSDADQVFSFIFSIWPDTWCLQI